MYDQEQKDAQDVTLLLRQIRAGEHSATAKLYELVYPELQKLARVRRKNWSGDHTLSSTALINEAYLKLSASGNQDWKNRAHFFRVASRAMRQILLNYRQQKSAIKRGGTRADAMFDDSIVPALGSAADIAALEQALQNLETLDRRLVQVFECRRLGGLSIAETADVLGLSVSTVKRDSTFVESWLRNAMSDDLADAEGADVG